MGFRLIPFTKNGSVSHLEGESVGSPLLHGPSGLPYGKDDDGFAESAPCRR